MRGTVAKRLRKAAGYCTPGLPVSDYQPYKKRKFNTMSNGMVYVEPGTPLTLTENCKRKLYKTMKKGYKL